MKKKLSASLAPNTTSLELKLIQEFGDNSNSFLALYPGFKWFTSSPEPKYRLAYVETKFSWVGVSHPFCPPLYLDSLLMEFAQAASNHKKCAVLFPLHASVALRAQQVQFGSMMIGVEVEFDLSLHNLQLKALPNALSLFKKGYRVSEFRPENLTSQEKKEITDALQSWTKARKTKLLEFVNTLLPWEWSQEKKYFFIRGESSLGNTQDKIQGLIAAVPIYPTKGWYFLDTIRHNEAPAGTMELLMIESMRQLKKQGFKHVSLGVAPLAELQRDQQFAKNKLLQCMAWIFENVTFFYRFKPLYDFKLKLRPTHLVPVYIAFYPKGVRFKLIAAVMEAFFPTGILGALKISLKNLFSSMKFFEWMEPFISSDLLLRKNATTLPHMILQARFCWVIMGVSATIFSVLKLLGPSIFSTAVDNLGFSLATLWHQDKLLQRIFFSGLLHWDWTHLLANLLGIAIICMLLESLLGGALVLSIFVVGQITANCLTGLLFFTGELLLTPWVSLKPSLFDFPAVDVGASLGLYACWGALLFCLKNKMVPSILTILICLIPVFHDALTVQTIPVIQFNHLTALLIGYTYMQLIKKNLGKIA